MSNIRSTSVLCISGNMHSESPKTAISGREGLFPQNIALGKP